MARNFFKVLNTHIRPITTPELEQEIAFLVNSKDTSKSAMGKVNAEFLLKGLESEEFRKTTENFDLNIADGISVLWAAKYLSLPVTKIPVLRQIQAIWQMIYTGAGLVFYPKSARTLVPELFSGVDAMRTLVKTAAEKDTSIFLFGGEKEVVEKAAEVLKQENPNLNIAGYNDGYNYNNEQIIEEINRSGAKILFVAMGSPKQEYWIRDNIEKLHSVKLAVAEGGSLDFLAGSFKRAPRWMVNLGLEWLFRLFYNKSKTPTASRATRVWKAVPFFIFKTVQFKLGQR